MKKRVLSVLLVIALLVAVGIVAAQASETEPDWQQIVSEANEMTFEEGKIPTYCPKCGDGVEWKPLTGLTRVSGGHYYLADDSNNSGLVNESGNLCLHLNDKTLSSTGAMATIYTYAGEVNIMGKGYVNGINPGQSTVRIDTYGTGVELNVYGGEYTNNKANGSVFGNSNGTGTNTMNFYGGKVEGTNGVEIQSNSGYINVYGGEYAYIASTYSGTLTVNGGTIAKIDNKWNAIAASTGDIIINGGNITTLDATNFCTLKVTGGTIGTLNTGANTSPITLAGAPNITAMNLANGITANAEGLTGGEIGLGSTTGVFTTAFDSKLLAEDAISYFKPVEGKEVTANNDNKLVVGNKTYSDEDVVTLAKQQDFGDQAVTVEKFCYACGKVESWQPKTDFTAVSGGHYYLSGDLIGAAGGNGLANNSGTLCLHLNDKTLSNTLGNSTITPLGGTVNIMGKGNVNGSSNARGTVWINGANVELNVYGGQFSNSSGNAFANGNGSGTSTMNFYGGKVEGNTGVEIQSNSGHINVFGGEYAYIASTFCGTLTVNGGTITKIDNRHNTKPEWTGNIIINGGNITTLDATNYCTLTVNGGTIGTLNTAATTSSITLTGAPTITALNLAKPADVTGLSQGASIGIAAKGIISTQFNDAQDKIQYFNAPSGTEIKVVEGQLVCDGITLEGPAEKVKFANDQKIEGTGDQQAFCAHCNDTKTWKQLTDTAGMVGSEASGTHFYLAGNVERTGALFNYHGSICVHLNGNNLSTSGASVFTGKAGNAINVMGTGEVTCDSNMFSCNTTNGTEVNIYGGNFSTTGDYVVSANSSTAEINIYGGELGASAKTSILAANGAAINLAGGKITDGVYLDNVGSGTCFTLTDGSVEGGLGGYGTFRLQGGSVGSDIETITISGDSILNLGNTKIPANLRVNQDESSNIVIEQAFTGAVKVMLNTETLAEDETPYGKTALGVTAPGGLKGTVIANVRGDVSTVYGLLSSEADDGTLVVAKTSIVDGENETWYINNAAAVNAFNGTGYIKLYTEDDIALNKAVAIDFNGQQLVEVTGSGTLTGIDTSTKDNFEEYPGQVLIAEGIELVVDEPTSAADGTVSGYLPVTDDVTEQTTFTYFKMKLSGIALRANKTSVGLYYKGTWSFNKNVESSAAGKISAGVIVNAVTDIDKDFRKGDYNFYTEVDIASIENGKPVTSMLVKDIMLDTNSVDDNDENGRWKINAAAYLCVNGVDILTDVRDTSVMDVLKMFEEEKNKEFFEDNMDKLGEFYQYWAPMAKLESWDLQKISKIEIAD